MNKNPFTKIFNGELVRKSCSKWLAEVRVVGFLYRKVCWRLVDLRFDCSKACLKLVEVR